MTLQNLALSAVLLAGLSPPLTLAASAPAGLSATPEVRREGNLVLHGVPAVPPEVVERLGRYLEARGAGLVAWDESSGGMLVTTRFGETAQLHSVASPGAARAQRTFFPEPVSWAAFDPARPGEGFLFSMDAGGGEAHQYYWMDGRTGRHALITDGRSRNQSATFANAGGQFAYTSTARNGRDYDLHVASTSGGSSRLIREMAGHWFPLEWSPDDRQLLVGHFLSANSSSAHLLDLDSGELTKVCPSGDDPMVACESAVFSRQGATILYTSDEGSEFQRLRSFDPKTGAHQVVGPETAWDVESLVVSRDGKRVAWALNEGGRSTLHLAASNALAKPLQLDIPLGVASGLGFDRGSKRLGFTLSTSTSSSDAWSVDVRTRKPTRWTFSETGGIPESAFVTEELIEFTSFDGRKIPSWLHLPTNAKGKVPVVISIHGGPEGQARPRFSSLTQYWVNALGVAVLTPNVRGSSGYGKSYLLLDNGMKREDSVRDIGALLDWIAQRDDLDASRVAVSGGSYGGYMVLASLIHFGDRIRCGVDSVGISNFVTFLESTSEYRRDLRRAEYGDERDAAMRAHLIAISPTTNAERLKQPLLVAQGLNDPRVPAAEAAQIVAAARANGVEVWYLLAEDEGHGFAKKGNRDALNGATSLFFERFLLAPARPGTPQGTTGLPQAEALPVRGSRE